MGMRVSVFLVCVGAILALGTDVSVSGVDLTVVGITVVGAGAIGLLMTLLVWDPKPWDRPRRAVRSGVSSCRWARGVGLSSSLRCSTSVVPTKTRRHELTPLRTALRGRSHGFGQAG